MLKTLDERRCVRGPMPSSIPASRLPLLIGALAVFAASAGAQTRNPKDTLDMGRIFDRRIEMITMRDGARLYTEIYLPKSPARSLPMLMERTPYDARTGLSGFRPTETGFSTRLHDHTELVRDRYIFVFQDLRGRFRSTGTYQTLRPPRDKRIANSTDESTDTYDTIDWLVKNVRNTPNEIVHYPISLRDRNHRFLKGHRLMVQVQSTWFPLVDRNPQKFVPNIFMAAAADFQVATQRVYRSSRFPSHIALPVRR